MFRDFLARNRYLSRPTSVKIDIETVTDEINYHVFLQHSYFQNNRKRNNRKFLDKFVKYVQLYKNNLRAKLIFLK